jgi:hypothetical protein
LSQNVQIIATDQAVLCSVDNWDSFLANNAAEREADYSPSSFAEIKNAWSCISNPHMRPGVFIRNSSCTADVTVHGTVLVSPQNRFMEKVFTDGRIFVTLYTGGIFTKNFRENPCWFKIEQK